MDYSEYISTIGFKYIDPETSLPRGHGRLANILRKTGFHLDVFNTSLPSGEKPDKEMLKQLKDVPRMSTFALSAMINRAVSQLAPDNAFVNVGVWHGFTFLSGILGNPGQRCVGVDNFSQFGGPKDAFLERFQQYKSANHAFYDLDYRKYFSDVHKGPVGFYIYDGAHDYQNQFDGLKIAEPFFSSDCLVLVDDTNWLEPKQATLDFIAQSENKYRILMDRSTSSNYHPTLWNGVLVFQRIT